MPLPFGRQQLARLEQAVDWSLERLRPYREVRVELIRRAVGYHYGENGTSQTQPVNLLDMATNIFVRNLAAQSPRVLVTTPHLALKPTALKLELAINHLLDEIKFSRTLAGLVKEAIFGVAIAKIGLEPGAAVEINGFLHDVGQPYADIVPLDDLVLDMTARRWDQIRFIGNVYRLPYELVLQSGLFIPEALAELSPTPRPVRSVKGDSRAESIGVGESAGSEDEEYRDSVDLMDLWLPLENRVITVVPDNFSLLLRDIPWEGPEGGPYQMLGFIDVPGNLLPVSPLAHLVDLNDLGNSLFRKLSRQAQRQKTWTGVLGAPDQDGNRLVDVNDGDVIRIDNPGGSQQFSTGGIDPTTLAFFTAVRDIYTWLGGNLDALGGLSPQSETLGQDQLLHAQASKLVSEMQGRVVEFTAGIVRDLAWYLWSDPLINLPLVKPDSRFGAPLQTQFTNEDKQGDFLDYNFSIEPYSMHHLTPSERLQNLMMVFNQVIVPFSPMLAEQGMTINLEGLLKTIARYTNMNELEDVLMFSNRSPQQFGATNEPAAPKPATTTRRYERVNRPGATREGKDDVLMRALMGSRSQPAEAATLNRRVS